MTDKSKFKPAKLTEEFIPDKKASQWWVFKSTSGTNLIFTERFDNADGSKAVKPRCYVKNIETGEEGWFYGNIHDLTPLYNLENFNAQQNKSVLIVEGEKTAEAAKKLLGNEYWCTTWLGGCGQVKKAKLNLLKGREVHLLPDNDEPGRKAMQYLASELLKLDCKVYIVSLPEKDFPKAWDIADDFPENWNLGKFKELIFESPLYKPETATEETKGKEAKDGEEPLQGRGVLFPEILPYPKPVDGAELVNAISNQITKYVRLRDEEDLVIAYWVLQTYGINHFPFAPRLAIISPEKQCGKTTLLKVLENLSFQALNVSNATCASLFRVIEACHPTVLIDEADSFLKDSEELRNIINAGHSNGGTVLRIVGKDHEPRRFDCFSACAIASIGKVPDTIMDRGIIINMRRLAQNEKVAPMRLRLIKAEMAEIRSKCLRFMNDHAQMAGEGIAEHVEGLGHRAFDNWEGLFLIADQISNEAGKKLREVAVSMAKSSQLDDTASLKVILLKDIYDIMLHEGAEYISSQELCKELGLKEDSPWSEFCRGSNITPNKLAYLLKDFKIKTKQKCVKGSNSNHYFKADFEDAFKRYLPNQGKTDPKSLSINCANGFGEEATSSSSEVKETTSRLEPLDTNSPRDIEGKSPLTPNDDDYWIDALG